MYVPQQFQVSQYKKSSQEHVDMVCKKPKKKLNFKKTWETILNNIWWKANNFLFFSKLFRPLQVTGI